METFQFPSLILNDLGAINPANCESRASFGSLTRDELVGAAMFLLEKS